MTAASRVGRRLPPGAFFITAEELYALPVHERDGYEVLLSPSHYPSKGTDHWSCWMSLAGLLNDGQDYRVVSIAHVPSSLVVVARNRPA